MSGPPAGPLAQRYRLDEVIGQGGMGTVYRAHDTLLDRPVAVKVLSQPGLGTEGRARLLREARAAAQLNYPNIVSVFDAGESDDSPFIVMELVEGESLHDRPPASLDETLAVARQVCAALEHAHAHGIVHRDLKPGNVIITPDGTAKLMDFGLARSASTQLTMEGALVGTVNYMAPEQALGQTLDGRTDLYALGVMLYELTTGRLPFTGDDPLAVISQHLYAPVVPPRNLRADLPPAFEALILALLAKNPADRPASAEAVAAALAEAGVPESLVPSARDETQNDLPIELTSFVGRKREIAAVKQWLSESRLVTLTGSGGCGKTRLALRVAAKVASNYQHGVWLVELAPLADPSLVPQAVASVLGVRESPGRLLIDNLLDYLRSRTTLLVLDNCEHLVEACARLADALLRGCPNLRVLATSRENLGVAGEASFRVPSLEHPSGGAGRLRVAELLSGYDAVRLFAERAQAALPGFALTEDNAPAVAQVCRRLDGIPLAIELAAARVATLRVEQIAGRLDDRFRLLTGGSRTAPPRHQTLRAMIDWSYGLLPAPERRLLRHLAVFVGGWRLEAAEAVCGADDEPVLDLLTQLVNKSLVQVARAPGAEARYWLLETVRQYAWDKLANAGETGAVQQSHFYYFLQLAERAEGEFASPEQVVWLDRLEAEHDNLRAALVWSQTAEGQAEAALQLAAALVNFWVDRGHLTEGRVRLAAALARPGAHKAAVTRAGALYGAGLLAYWQGDFPAARSLYENSLAVSRDLGPAGLRGVAWALDGLGDVAMEVGDFAASRALLQESLALMKRLNDKIGIGAALLILGWAALRTGDYSSAAQPIEEALALFRDLGNGRYIAMALGALGEMALRQEEYERAQQLLSESLALRREWGDRWGLAAALGTLGWAAMLQGDLPRARATLAKSLAVRQEVGDRGGMAWCLERLAEIALQDEEPEQAARIYGAAAASREPSGSVIDPADQPDYERQIAALKEVLGESGYAAAWEAGRALPLEQAIAEALNEGSGGA